MTPINKIANSREQTCLKSQFLESPLCSPLNIIILLIFIALILFALSVIVWALACDYQIRHHDVHTRQCTASYTEFYSTHLGHLRFRRNTRQLPTEAEECDSQAVSSGPPSRDLSGSDDSRPPTPDPRYYGYSRWQRAMGMSPSSSSAVNTYSSTTSDAVYMAAPTTERTLLRPSNYNHSDTHGPQTRPLDQFRQQYGTTDNVRRTSVRHRGGEERPAPTIMNAPGGGVVARRRSSSDVFHMDT